MAERQKRRGGGDDERSPSAASHEGSQRVITRGLGPRAAIVVVAAVFIAVVAPAALRSPSPRPHPPATPTAQASDPVAVVETPAPMPSATIAPGFASSEFQRCSQVSRDDAGNLTTSRDWTLVLDDRADLAWQCLVHADEALPDFDHGVWLAHARDPAVGPQVEVVWLGDPCRDEVVIRTERTRDQSTEPGYTLVVEELENGSACSGFAVERSAVLFIRRGVNPDTIHPSKKPTGAPPIHPGSGSERVIRCALPAATEIVDLTGLIVDCESSPHDDRSSLISVGNPRGDLRRLRVRWMGESCSGSGTSIRVMPLGDTVGVLVRPTRYRDCEGWQFPLGLTFSLQREVDADDVVAVRRLRLLDRE